MILDDHSLVKLTPINEDLNSTYINANWIQVMQNETKYNMLIYTNSTFSILKSLVMQQHNSSFNATEL